MRVLCVKIINPVTNEEVLEHPAIRIDEEYPVVSVLVQTGRIAKLRVITRDGTPALFGAAMFVSVDQTVPPNWVVRVSEGGLVEFAPSDWLEPEFWERFFDGEAEAVESFEIETRPMLEPE